MFLIPFTGALNYKKQFVYPPTVLAYVGSSVKLTCFSHGTPMWVKKKTNEIIPNHKVLVDVLTNRYRLVLNNVKLEDSSKYYCHGKIRGKKFKSSGELYVGCK